MHRLFAFIFIVLCAVSFGFAGSVEVYNPQTAGGLGAVTNEVDTLQTVTARGNTTTNDILSSGIVSGNVVRAANGFTGNTNGFVAASGIVTGVTVLSGFEADTLQTVTARGSGTTNAVQLDGGGTLTNWIDITDVDETIVNKRYVDMRTAFQGCYIYTGGAIWLSNLTFTVSDLAYSIGGYGYASLETNITLSAAHATLNRIDTIIADFDGAISVLAGTAAVDPIKPVANCITEVEVTHAYIPAGATTPTNVTEDVVYQENVEWPVTTSGNMASNLTVNPYQGTVHCAATNATVGHWLQFNRTSVLNLTNYDVFSFRLRNVTNWPTTRGVGIVAYLTNAVVGTAVLFNGQYGFSATNTSAYQLVVIPKSAFGLTGQAITRMRFVILGSAGSLNWRLDDVRWTAGLPPLLSNPSFGIVIGGDGQLNATVPQDDFSIQGAGQVTTTVNTVTSKITISLAGGATGASNGIQVASGVVTGFTAVASVSGVTTATVYRIVVAPNDIHWGSLGSIANSNNAAPVYYWERNATRTVSGLGFVSSDTVGLQSRYAGAYLRSLDDAVDWGSDTGLVINVLHSTPSAVTNKVDVRLIAANGTIFATNSLTSSATNTLTSYYILTNDLGAISGWQSGATTNKAWIDLDYQTWAGRTSTVINVEAYIKVQR